MDAILLAAGQSSRLGSTIDKQMHRINNKPLVIYSAERLLANDSIDRLVIVGSDGSMEELQLIFKEFNLIDNCDFVLGGSERQESVRNSLAAIESDRVLLHEGARPVISASLIERVLAPDTACVTPTVPVPFTVAIGETMMDGELDRSLLHNVQLPQVFDTQILLEAHERALSEGSSATDDSALVFRLGYPVKFVEGELTNIKVTYPNDLLLIEKILNE
ncbi:MAG: 2-C-methyl-D-erythritol 4-phosphate cytidylyltransferase [Acidimicrobiaceae bacterium]|nr:2-C-methyl-D-erythritol 4-phosphate cytidylyltransferase [Acidimicrobiaceae bacterium]|tara:strand:+ start:437 stop:1093 length:657 start_codon:yes stop_codon:yes gene_type:complete